jgi:prepilin-type N-terminal cleavage/methylation domain-containing protein
MRTTTGPQRQEAGQGFTLIELLLATVLLLLLLGAVVFNFSSLEQGARLDEGASQFESMLRFARAQATSSGRQVLVSFAQEEDLDGFRVLDKVRVTWEPDPLGQPGVFEELPQTVSYLERINELVQVDSLRTTEPGRSETGLSFGRPGPVEEKLGSALDFLPPLRFHPDGSSDSAEIVLVSRDEQDKRRVSLRLVGITGMIKRSVVDETEPAGSNEVETATTESRNKTAAPATKAPPKASSATPIETPKTPGNRDEPREGGGG